MKKTFILSLIIASFVSLGALSTGCKKKAVDEETTVKHTDGTVEKNKVEVNKDDNGNYKSVETHSIDK